MRTFLKILAFIGIFFAGYVVSQLFGSAKSNATEQSRVLLEKINTVSKLVTVEGQFSEIYDYKDYWGYDFSPFQKKALVRIKAKASVGYDLSKMKVESRPLERKIIISALPEPEVISLDHSLDYYDITQGSFNPFTTEDYTKINEKAKEMVKTQAQNSELFAAARKQGNQMLDMIRFIVESAGWKLEIKNQMKNQMKNEK
jgi:Protein of unknown function (DUF4230)